MPLKSGFFNALEAQSQLSDADDLVYTLAHTTKANTANTSFSTANPTTVAGTKVNYLDGTGTVTFSNPTGTFNRLDVKVRTGTQTTTHGTLTFTGSTVTVNGTDVQVTQAQFTWTQEAGMVKLADTTIGATQTCDVFVVNNGTATDVASITGVTFSVSTGNQSIDAINGSTETGTATQTASTVNGLRMEVNTGTTTTISEGTIGSTTTVTNGQQVQVTAYTITTT